jgi:hypothetical protein
MTACALLPRMFYGGGGPLLLEFSGSDFIFVYHQMPAARGLRLSCDQTCRTYMKYGAAISLNLAYISQTFMPGR